MTSNDEFKRVILEIYECFKLGAITPMFQKIKETYEEELILELDSCLKCHRKNKYCICGSPKDATDFDPPGSEEFGGRR